VDNRKQITRISKIIVLLFAFSILTYYFILPRIASFLILETEDLQPADVIVILGGSGNYRINQGIELYKTGYSPQLILTGDKLVLDGVINTTLPEYWEKVALESGVSPDAIILLNSTSTFEEAQYSREIMLERNYRSAIIVSDPYHMRRVELIFSKVFKNDGISISYKATEGHWFKVDKWWTRERELITVYLEYPKLVYYWLKY